MMGPMFVQESPEKRRLEALSRILQQQNQGFATEGSKTPMEAAARAGKQIVDAFVTHKQMGAEEEREQSRRDTMARALEQYNKAQAGGETMFGDGEKITWNKASPNQAKMMMANILQSNPDTVDMAMQMRMNDFNNQMALQSEIEKMKTLQPYELDMAREKAKIAAQYRAKPTGGDTGVLINQLIEEDNGIDTKLDALRAIKGGAGASGKHMSNIKYGRKSNFETQSGKNESDLLYKPQIASESARQSEIGKAAGVAGAELDDREATLPRLEQVVDELSQLGQKATYTMTGRVEDAIQREIGINPGEDAIARTEYISKVDNEILPLLRQTFGAQFTEREGQSLKATLGDPNKSPAEKDAVLRSFIAQKRSQIDTLKRRVGNATDDIGVRNMGLQDIENAIGATGGSTAQETKVINGKTYVKIGGQWYEQ